MKNLSLLLLSLFCCSLYAQDNYYSSADALPNVSITGTSTLHDWTATAGVVNNYQADLSLTLAEGAAIDSFAFSVEVASLDGGRGAAMNDKIYKALLSDTHPLIRYQQTTPAILAAATAGGYVLTSTGILSMAGVEKEITVAVNVAETDAHQLILKGNKDLKMSDFGITPPSAMFGQIQTDDAVTVHFEFVYKKKD